MKNLEVLEYDHLTGEIIERLFTDDEQNDFDFSVAAAQQRQNEIDAKAAARQSALAKLADLGLTAEEIAAL